MVALLIIAHAPLASSLLAVAQHAYPDCARSLHALDVQPADNPETVEAHLRAMLAAAGAGETLILTDVVGATPCNVALRVADGVRTQVVAGVNVPMVWRVLCYSAEALGSLAVRAVDGGAQGVVLVAAPNRSVQ